MPNTPKPKRTGKRKIPAYASAFPNRNVEDLDLMDIINYSRAHDGGIGVSDELRPARDFIVDSMQTIGNLQLQLDVIHQIQDMLVKCLKRGNKLLTCGNGGSAAEAMHLAEELTGKYHKPRRALPAICLCSDASAMTCIANDWDFTFVFSRQVEAFAKKGDLLIMFTTSGNSTNCIRAAHAMKKAGGKVIGLLGKGGGKAKPLCDLALVVDSPHTNHIQEAHQVLLHLLLEAIDAEFS